MGGGKEIEFTATNPAKARVGDTVVLDFKTGRMLQLSFLLYIFPIILLVAGAIIGDRWGSSTGADPSITAAALGFAGFFLAVGVIMIIEKGAKKSDRYKPVIVGVKKSGEKCEHRRQPG